MSLVENARALKVDPEVVNQKVLALFRGKQGTKELREMMRLATEELMSVRPSYSKSVVMTSPQVYHRNTLFKPQDRRKRGTAASIMTQQLSSSSQGAREQVLNMAPSFAPKSPVSAGGHAENAVLRPSINFGLNSVGASTNRCSKWELPVFGGVISSRGGGDNADSKSSMKKMVETIEKCDVSNELNVTSPASDQLCVTGAVRDKARAAAPIIDYSQNILSVTSHRAREKTIRKGSFEVSAEGNVRRQKVASPRLDANSTVKKTSSQPSTIQT